MPTETLLFAVASSEKLIPPTGIYAVRGVTRAGTFDGALHLGPRPTFLGAPPTIELYLLDFDGDLYGENVRVDFVERLRDVLPFESVDALVAKIAEDVAQTRTVMARWREGVQGV